MQAIGDALKILAIMGAGFGVLILVAIANGRAIRRKQAEQKLREQKKEVADLIIPNVDPALARALKESAAAHGRSAEAELLDILAKALGKPAP